MKYDTILCEFLEPTVWRRLCALATRLEDRGRVLCVLAEEGAVPRAVWQNGAPARVDGLAALVQKAEAEAWLAACPEAAEVRVFTKQGLLAYQRAVQQPACYRDMDSAAYLRYMYDMLQSTPGVQVYRRRPFAPVLVRLDDMLAAVDKGAYVLVLWVTSGGALHSHALLEVRGEQVCRLTTCDRYHLAPDQASRQALAALAAEEFGLPVVERVFEVEQL